jgi:hypothetical protein
VVKTSGTREKVCLSLLHMRGTSFERLEQVYSVTFDGKLRFTEAEIERPDAEAYVAHVCFGLTMHQALSYLRGLELKLAGLVDGKWMLFTERIVDAPIAEFGLVVPENLVRVVKLKIGDMHTPIVLRQYPDKSLLQALRSSCDWKAWPAVSACTEEPIIKTSARNRDSVAHEQ